MPKHKASHNAKYQKYIKIFGANILTIKGKSLFCIPCNHEISGKKKSLVWV